MTAVDPALFANMHAFWGSYDPRGATTSARGLVTYASGLAHPLYNGVMRARLDSSEVPAVAGRLRQQFVALGLPATWWVGPDSAPDDLGDRLTELAMPCTAMLTVMTVDLATLPEEAPPAELEGRLLEGVDEVTPWARLAAEVFGLAEPAGSAYVTRETTIAAADRYARFGGWVDGRLVATAALTTDAGIAGIYAVATRAGQERRGYGRALTLAALREGHRRGLAVGTLQATPGGHPVYRRLGFTDVGVYRLHTLAG